MAKLGPPGKLSSALRCSQSHTIRFWHALDEISLKTYVVEPYLLVVEMSVKTGKNWKILILTDISTTRR